MSLTVFGLCAIASFASPPPQNTLVVDGNTGAPYSSITSAAAAATTGDTIKIVGMTDPATGDPRGYCEAAVLNSTGEQFPIVIPPGVKVRKEGTAIVGVYTVSSSTNALFALQGYPAGTNDADPTLLEGLLLIGGSAGVSVDATSGGLFPVELSTVGTSWNTRGVEVHAASLADVELVAQNCQIRDVQYVFGAPGVPDPDYSKPPGIGFALSATEAGNGPGRIVATINNLGVVGAFTTMQRPAFHGPQVNAESWADLAHPNNQASRVVDVFAQGISEEYPGKPLHYVKQRISEVVLTVSGGSWDGRFQGTPGQGWDLGIYAATGENSSLTPIYSAGYKVSTSGLALDRFHLAGIYATTSVNTRGELFLNGGTQITRTGNGVVTAPVDWFHSGVHLYNREGYLALHANGLVSVANHGSGVFLNSPETFFDWPEVPVGTYLDLQESKLHQNGDSGLRLRGGLAWGNWNGGRLGRLGAIVGGTWDEYDTFGYGGAKSFIDWGYEPFGPAYGGVSHGQGLVHRCAISNNAHYGVHLEVKGNGDATDKDYAAISARFSDDIVWNNGIGEFYADLTEVPNAVGGPFLLTPVVHSTLVGPENAGLWTMEVAETLPGNSFFYREEQQWAGGGGAMHYLCTRVYNSIFQRGVVQSGSVNDFGPNLKGQLVRVDQLGLPPAPHKIDMAGIRQKGTPGGFVLGTNDDTPWLNPGSISLASLVALQFVLDPNVLLTNIFRNSPPFMNIDMMPATEVETDYSGDTRVDPLIYHEKGAEEIL